MSQVLQSKCVNKRYRGERHMFISVQQADDQVSYILLSAADGLEDLDNTQG